MQIGWADSLMMRGGMVLGEIIGMISVARPPKAVKLSLADAISDPIKAHVDGLGSFLFDHVIGNTTSHAVVSLERGGRLQMAKFI